MNNLEYFVVSSDDYKSFVDTVNTNLSLGGTLIGGVYVDRHHGDYAYIRYYQAMTFPKVVEVDDRSHPII